MENYNNITKKFEYLSSRPHTIELDKISFEKKLSDFFRKCVNNWFSLLNDQYRNALITLDFDRTIITSTMFFPGANSAGSIAFDYDRLTEDIVSYLTAENVMSEFRRDASCVPHDLWMAFLRYREMIDCREKLVKTHNELLCRLSSEVKEMVIRELLENENGYKRDKNTMLATLSDYRKKFLNAAIDELKEKYRNEGKH